jgi:hypothetical protein
VLLVPHAAGAACTSAGSMTTPSCVTTPTIVPPGTSASHTTPVPVTTSATHDGTVDGTSSLPFTGADVAELAVVGSGAVLVGVLLTRRRRSQAA